MPACSKGARGQAGLTLVELIITIVVLGIAAVAVLQSLGVLVLRNVDPMLRSQSRLLAEAMINEIQTRAFFDPAVDPTLDPSNIPTSICPTQTIPPDADRNAWNDICDYNSYDSGSAGPRFRDGNVIPGLSGYQVQVTVDASVSSALTLGGDLSNQAGCVPQLARITVTVTDPRGQPLKLDAYRTSYYNDTTGGCYGNPI